VISGISEAKLKDWEQAQKPFQLIDVREADERVAHNIGGDWIPLGEIIRRREEISREIPVVFYCRKGIRSQIAIQRLLGTGQFNSDLLFNLTGGIGEG
jgi:rhodanese-related sulfurtransferase